MATATANKSNHQQQLPSLAEAQTLLERVLEQTEQGVRDAALERLLEQSLDKQPDSKRRVLDSAIRKRADKLRDMLPDKLKEQAERFISTAMLYFSRRADLKACPTAEFVWAVFEGAKLGLAIDGRLAHVVKYGKSYTFQADYKGMIAVAKRLEIIEDVYLDTICEHDHYVHKEIGAGTEFCHNRPSFGASRGKVVGAYCRLLFPNGRFKVVDMDVEELDAIRRRAPAQNGPWKSDTGEMYKKTVCKRALKLYTEDAGMIGLFGVGEGEWDEPLQPEPDRTMPPVGRENLRQRQFQPPIIDADEPVEPAPSELDGEGAMAQQDTFDDLSERIGTAEDPRDLTTIDQAIGNAENVLGMMLVTQLRDLLAERRRQLAG